MRKVDRTRTQDGGSPLEPAPLAAVADASLIVRLDGEVGLDAKSGTEKRGMEVGSG